MEWAKSLNRIGNELLQSAPVGPAERQMFAILHNDFVFAFEHRVELLDPIHVYNDGPMDPRETARVEFSLQAAHGLTYQI